MHNISLSPSPCNLKTSSVGMTKSNDAVEDFCKNDKKKKSILKIFSGKQRDGRQTEERDTSERRHQLTLDIEGGRWIFPADSTPTIQKCYSDRPATGTKMDGLNLSNRWKHHRVLQIEDYRIFVATWNVGGRSPNADIDLEDFLQIEGSSDIYVLGFQEIVPLNAGNVLVSEDNEPAVKWLALISQALNKPQNLHGNKENSTSHRTCYDHAVQNQQSHGHNLFHKTNVKAVSKHCKVEDSLLKTCNCIDAEDEVDYFNRRLRTSRNLRDQLALADDDDGKPFGYDNEEERLEPSTSSQDELNYCLVSSKQMVGIFLAVWVRSDLVQHVAHLRTSSLGRGIMGCLGNKGCIAISMSLHQTSFCFVCSHLASGEKEGDELKRNADVVEILKNTQFPKICKSRISQIAEKILDHDRIIWLGDLNYRISLSYDEAINLLEDNNWDELLERDQLNIERISGRVFKGWKEGKIYFAPTYKYTQNSDCYAGETVKSKKKRRTPAWCDRILWRGQGIDQVCYVRGESRFSDHRPVCAVFSVKTEAHTNKNNKCRKGYSSVIARTRELDDCISQRHSFYVA